LGPQFVKDRIRKKLGNSFYLLEDLQGKEIGTFHAWDIRSLFPLIVPSYGVLLSCFVMVGKLK